MTSGINVVYKNNKKEAKMKKVKGISLVMLTIFVLVTLISIPSCKKQEEKVIKIGVMLPLTGGISFIGENFKNGLLLAQNEFGVKQGVKIVFEIEDHKNSSKNGVSIMRKFLMEGNMPIVVSTITSVTNAILPLIKGNPRVIISSITSGSKLPDKSQWLFRYFLSTVDEVSAMVSYLSSIGEDTVGIFYVNDDYGLDAMEVFSRKYRGFVKFKESYDKSAFDFKNLVPLAKTAKAIYILGYGSSYGIFVKQLREYGYKGNIYAFSSFGNPEVLKQAGEYAKGVIFTGSNFYLSKKNKDIASFVKNYEDLWHKKPDHYSAYGYDIGRIVFKIINELVRNNEEVTPDVIRKKIMQWKNFEGLFGSCFVMKNGDFRFKEVKILKIGKDNKIEEITF